MIVRWGIETLPEVLKDLSVEHALLISTERWRDLDVPVERRFLGALPHAEMCGVKAAIAAADGADGLVALGGGSAIDTAKAVSTALGLPIISVPTTYSGAEWTEFYGNRDTATGVKSAGAGAAVKAIVYEPKLTLGLSAFDTCGTAMNALAHCAEALYSPKRNAETDADGLKGARLIAEHLPRVLADAEDLDARRGLLEGAMLGGRALKAGMALGHGMAQALGGGLGLPHGALNAVCLPHALRFNREVAKDAIAALGEAMRTDDPITRCHELGALACPMRLRDYDVAKEALPAIAEKVAVRPAALANPQPASAADILELLNAAW